MKECVKTVFIIIGSVIGAGFISGRELVRFFGRANLAFLLLNTLFFFLFLVVLLRVGKRYGGFRPFLNKTLKKKAWVVDLIFNVCAFVVVTAMLAGVNALEERYAPFIALLTAGGCFFIVKKGVGGMGLFNLLLVPVILCYVYFLLFQKNTFQMAIFPQNVGMGATFCLLYVAMNLFLSVPVVMDAGANFKSEKSCFFTAFFSALLIGFSVALVLSAISATDGAELEELPLYYVLNQNGLFALMCYLGIVTTLVSSYYPLYTALGAKKHGGVKQGIVLLLSSLCSLFGLKEIVDFFYPVMGIFGVVFLAVVVFHDDFFQKIYRKIHGACKGAKDQGRSHNKV